MKNCKQRFSEFLKAASAWKKKEINCAFTIFSAKPCFTKRYPQNLVKKYEPAYTRTISLKPCFMKNRKEQFSEFCQITLGKEKKEEIILIHVFHFR